MDGFGFLLQNFGKVVGTYECHLLLCKCRWTGGPNEENAKPHAHNVLPTSGEKRRETGLEKLFEVSTFDTLFCDIYLGRAELFM